MNSCLIYYTHFGNTKRIAEAIAGVLAGAGETRTMSIDELSPAELVAADLIVVGSPTHYQNLPKAVRASLATLPRRALRGKRVAAFDEWNNS